MSRIKVVGEQDVEEDQLLIDVYKVDKASCPATVCISVKARPPTYARLEVEGEAIEFKELEKEFFEEVALEFLYIATDSYTIFSATIALSYLVDRLLKVPIGRMEVEHKGKEWIGRFEK